MIITLVMSRMDKILWIDKKNMLVCAGPGIRGDLFEKTLEKEGVILGHEPVIDLNIILYSLIIGFGRVLNSWGVDINTL